jgi:hypothetical protein
VRASLDVPCSGKAPETCDDIFFAGPPMIVYGSLDPINKKS